MVVLHIGQHNARHRYEQGYRNSVDNHIPCPKEHRWQPAQLFLCVHLPKGIDEMHVLDAGRASLLELINGVVRGEVKYSTEVGAYYETSTVETVVTMNGHGSFSALHIGYEVVDKQFCWNLFRDGAELHVVNHDWVNFIRIRF